MKPTGKPAVARRRAAPGRRPHLKVVGGEPTPLLPHVAALDWTLGGDHRSIIVRFWTDAEWAALADWERPPAAGTARLHGAGYVYLKTTSLNDHAARDARETARQVAAIVEPD